MLITYKHPQTGDVQQIDSMDAAYNSFVLGPLYFMAKGMKKEVLRWTILFIVTLGISWLVYPFYIKQLLHRHYLSLGYERHV